MKKVRQRLLCAPAAAFADGPQFGLKTVIVEGINVGHRRAWEDLVRAIDQRGITLASLQAPLRSSQLNRRNVLRAIPGSEGI